MALSFLSLRRSSRAPLASRRAALLPALGVVAALALTGCGSDEESVDAAPVQSNQRSGPEDGSGDVRGGFPGAVGKVAAVSGTTAQVQGSDGQVAVAFGDATITTQKTVSASAVRKGDCVTVTFASSGEDSESADAVASRISLSDAVDSECSAFGGAGGPGGRNGGPGGDGDRPGMPEGPEPPSDGERPEMPEGVEPPGDGERPEGAPQGGRGGVVNGKVTAVKDGALTVEVSAFPGRPGEEDADADEAESRTVTLGTETTYTRTVTGAASDVKEGRCVMATGTTDDTGALTAETVQVSDAVDGECGFGGFGGGRGPGRPGGESTGDDQ